MKGIHLISVLILLLGCSTTNDDLESVPNIELNKEALTLAKGKSERLIAAFMPADTPQKGHAWNSSAPNIATIDETGLVTAIDLGETIITVTALHGKKTATCKITVVDKIVNVTAVSLDEAETSIALGDVIKLTAIVKPDTATDKTIKWSSSDNKVASVDKEGNVTALTNGSVTITATTNDSGKTASCKITVVDKGVKISKPEVSDITSISAFVTGIARPLGVKIKEVGICYSTSPSPTIEDKKVILSGENISGILNKLDPNTTYYVRIYAIVDDSAKYGDQTMFTTKATVEISTPKISSLSTYTAYIEGTITTFGLQTEETGLCYSTSPRPTVNDTKVVLSSNNITYTLNELNPETKYYLRIYAKLGGEFYYGEEGEFTTLGIIKTHFEPTDIYDTGAIRLTSPAPAGITEVNICYGTSPNPKITDNITTAKIENDGKLHLHLSLLKSATTYYIRAYSRMGSKIEYYDDEVSVQTMGRDFSINYKIAGYAKYEIYEGIHFERYRLVLDFTYSIKSPGTYLVEVDDNSNSFLKKSSGGAYSKSIYIKDGNGTFTFMKEGGREDYEGASSYISFDETTDIRIRNLEGSICYHYSVRRSWYVL